MLDVGCGAGNLCRQMRSAHASSVVGLDPSMRMLTVARAKEVQDENVARGGVCDPTAVPSANKQRPSVSGMFKKLFSNDEGGHEQVGQITNRQLTMPLAHGCCERAPPRTLTFIFHALVWLRAHRNVASARIIRIPRRRHRHPRRPRTRMRRCIIAGTTATRSSSNSSRSSCRRLRSALLSKLSATCNRRSRSGTSAAWSRSTSSRVA